MGGQSTRTVATSWRMLKVLSGMKTQSFKPERMHVKLIKDSRQKEKWKSLIQDNLALAIICSLINFYFLMFESSKISLKIGVLL